MACFSLAKQVGANPADIASQLAEGISSDELVDSAQATGPFLNMSMKPAFYVSVLNDYETTTHQDTGETVIVDYMGTNIGKPAHI